MKRLVICIYGMTLALAMSAQSLVSFGGRGGFDFMVPGSEQSTTAKFGVAGAADIGYTYYWHVGGLHNLGLHTGLSAGYATNESQINLDQQYVNRDYLNHEMIYTTTGKTKVWMKRAYAELPLMVAYRHNNIIAQLGLKAQYSFWSTASQQVQEASIDAYYTAYDIHVTDQLITGRITDNEKIEMTIKSGTPTINLILAMRIGYEFRFKKKHILGVAAYLDANVWNNLSIPHIRDPHIAVAPITDPVNPPPTVTANNAFNTVIDHINPIQFGVSVYYALEFRLYSSFRNAQYEWDR